MYVLDLKNERICKMDNKSLAKFLNTLKTKEFKKFGFLHTKKLATDFIKRQIFVVKKPN